MIVSDSDPLVSFARANKDDPVARKEAKRRGLPLFSSLDILQEAKDQGFILELRKPLDELRAAGFHISSKLYREALQRAGEKV